MSQPDMFPEEAPREEPERRALHQQHEDLRALPFPLGDWGEPAERLEELYRWAESGALLTADWYLRDRVWKRRGARALRCGAALFAAVGAALPLVELTGTGGSTVAWGYLALLMATVCVVLDRVLGLTAGWMRDVGTAQGVERRLEQLRFDWASESVREVLGPTEGTASEAAERCLAILRRFCDDVADLVRMETADWMLDFGSRTAAGTLLRTQYPGWTPVRPEAPPAPRLPHPSTRPNMPRQRPPENPRQG
ncbi:SLATT domain-containing protein [Actinacidiphila bryophytorum]|uniref:SLATT_2 domain-containing protein n=1 Tax=Actinacidiphila bryophytorum TaxID=1436133 RepID=A0A9W4H1K4_9ACTN|nr:SLATT domain-containing protein [Actinacidiphila bryophytorum]CAG7643258.1 SLATT_2 domain-containing protein [Actinacidiphila bryophytorum]